MRLALLTWQRAVVCLACFFLADFDGRPDATCTALFLGSRMPEVSPSVARGAVLLCKADYATLASPVTKDPVWVAEHLTTVQIMSAGMIQRHCRFRPDRALVLGTRAELGDYRKSGWDRGHMAPDADMPDDAAQRESCDLANAVPQAPRLNRGIWARIEEHVRRLALFHGDVFVVTGPGFAGSPAAIGPDDVLVPDWTWKAVFVPSTGEHEAWVCSNVRNTACDEEPIAAVAQRFGVRAFPSETRAWAEEAPTGQ